jgi:hypothetical protein
VEESSLEKVVGHFCNFQKLPKVNNRPMGENSPNLVTLSGEEQDLLALDVSQLNFTDF